MVMSGPPPYTLTHCTTCTWTPILMLAMISHWERKCVFGRQSHGACHSIQPNPQIPIHAQTWEVAGWGKVWPRRAQLCDAPTCSYAQHLSERAEKGIWECPDQNHIYYADEPVARAAARACTLASDEWALISELLESFSLEEERSTRYCSATCHMRTFV